VDTDGGTVAAIDAVGNTVTRTYVGLEPTRIARAGERLFVTLRGERSLAVLERSDSGLTLLSKIPVGAEPFGVVASENGRRVYVAAALEGEVHEIDAETLEITRSWTVRDEPRWLALHPSGRSLFAGSVLGGVYSRIDLDADDSVQRRFLPELTSVHMETLDEIVLNNRITGDIAVSPNGKALAIPCLYVDNITPVGQPVVITDDDDFEDEVVEEIDTGYGSSRISRFNPGVILVALDAQGDFRVSDPVVLSLTGTGTDFETLRSYPAAVTFSPDGDSVIASLEGAGAVISLPVDGGAAENVVGGPMPMEVDGAGAEDMGFFGEGPAMSFRATRTWMTPAGPRGLLFLEDEEAVTYSFLDRQIARITHTPVPVQAGHRVEPTIAMQEEAGALESRDRTEFAPNALPEDVEAGRRLFYATDDSQMAASGAGVSCATCHFAGRNDGLTWLFADEDEFRPDHERQTPSLAGVVSMTAPVTWTDEVLSVFDEVVITSQGRMGGSGLAEADALKVASFVDWTREPDLPLSGSTSASVLAGKDIFEREDVGCADCHNGAAFTDNEAYDMYGLTGVRTRSLVGVAASAPFLHDGSAPTIEAVLLTATDGSMGDTSSLSMDELSYLASYIKSL
jgi:mono/diheme cytochrome c family protein